MRSLETGDSEAALREFRRALAIEERSDVALALAATLHQRGSLSEAVSIYDRLLVEEFGPLDDALAGAARRARDAADSARAVLSVMTDAEELEVDMNGVRVGVVSPEAPLVLRVDPGEHRLRAMRDDRISDPLSVHLRSSERRELTLHAPRIEQTVEPPEEPSPLRPSTAPARQPRASHWVLLGVALAPLAVGIGTGVAFRHRVEEARDAPNLRDADPLIDRAQTLGNVANVSYALTGVVAAAGLIWLIVDRRRASASLQLGLHGLQVGGAF